jgi:transcriptional regulator with XRE-family HTH domain
MEKLGNRIKKLRLANQWRQSYVATLLQISIPAYSTIETNNTTLTVIRMQQIADIFKIPVKMLMEEEAVYEHENIKKELEKRLAEQDASIQALSRKIIDLYEELHQFELEKT